MDNLLVTPIINMLQSLPAEVVSLILFAVCAMAILIMFRCFGVQGLYIYNVIAVLSANIQVLRGVQFSLSHEPVALGTVVFATTYLCSDIVAEHYGQAQAKLGVWFCFAAQIIMTLLMIIAVGYPPLSLDSGPQEMIKAEHALSLLFTPSPRLLFASLIAFIISQFNDIWLFQFIGKLTKQKWLWFRTTVSTLVSALVDTVLFSALAWIILSPNPINFSTMLYTYVLGTFITRVIINLFSTPVMYLSYSCRSQRLHYANEF